MESETWEALFVTRQKRSQSAEGTFDTEPFGGPGAPPLGISWEAVSNGKRETPAELNEGPTSSAPFEAESRKEDRVECHPNRRLYEANLSGDQQSHQLPKAGRWWKAVVRMNYPKSGTRRQRGKRSRRPIVHQKSATNRFQTEDLRSDRDREAGQDLGASRGLEAVPGWAGTELPADLAGSLVRNRRRGMCEADRRHERADIW